MYEVQARVSTVRARWAGAGAILLIVIAAGLSYRYAWVTWSDRVGVLESSPPARPILIDLRDATWWPVRAILGGEDPYDVPAYSTAHPTIQAFTLYAPAHLTLWSPLGKLPWDAAAALGILINLGAVVALGIMTGIKSLSLGVPRFRTSWLFRVCAASVGVIGVWAYRSVAVAFGLGQPSTIYLAATACLLLGWGGSKIQPLLVALSLLKPQTGVPVLLYLLVAHRVRDAVRGTLLTVVLSVPAVIGAAGGIQGVPAWVRRAPQAVSEVLASPDAGRVTAGRVDIGGGINRLIGQPSPTWVLAAAAAVFIPVVLLTRRYPEILRPPQTALLIGVALLATFPHFDYDGLLLFAPSVVALVDLIWHRSGGSCGLLNWAGVLSGGAAGMFSGPWTEKLGMVKDPSVVQQPLLVVSATLLITALLWRVRKGANGLNDTVIGTSESNPSGKNRPGFGRLVRP